MQVANYIIKKIAIYVGHNLDSGYQLEWRG